MFVWLSFAYSFASSIDLAPLSPSSSSSKSFLSADPGASETTGTHWARLLLVLDGSVTVNFQIAAIRLPPHLFRRDAKPAATSEFESDTPFFNSVSPSSPYRLS